MAQNDTSRIAGLPFSPYLIQVDSLDDMELENDKFVLGESAYTLVSNKYWEFIGLRIAFSAESSGSSPLNGQRFTYYKSKNDNPIIQSERVLFVETFEINKSRIFQLQSLNRCFGTSYPWTTIYNEEYLIIEKCNGYIGGQTSYETKFTYYFKENKVANFQEEYSQTDKKILSQINNVAELIDKEKFDTLILENIDLRFEILYAVSSPVNKRFNPSTSAYVLYNENGIRKLLVCGTWYYFDNEKLIKSHFRCTSDDYMGLCGGTYSEYENYFVNNKYYTTIENNTFKDIFSGRCPCSDNRIINPSSLENIILMFNEQK